MNNIRAIWESKFFHLLLVFTGTVFLLLAFIQIPAGMYYQNTKPWTWWVGVDVNKDGLVVGKVFDTQNPQYGQLKAGDIIQNINGLPLDSASFDSHAYRLFIRNLELGDTLRFKIKRAGVSKSFHVVLDQTSNALHHWSLTLSRYLWNAVSPLLTLLIALFILLRRPRNKQTAVYFLLSVCVAAGLLTRGQLSYLLPWWAELQPVLSIISEFFLIFFFPFLLHFTLIFPEESLSIRKRKRQILLVYGPVILLSLVWILLASIKGVRKTPDVFAYVFIGMYVVYTLLALITLIRSYRRSDSPTSRNVIRIILTGVLLFLVGVCGQLSISLLVNPASIGVDILIGLNIAFVLMMTFSLPISFGYALLRYGLMEVRIVFRRTIVYGILSVLVIALFIAVYIILTSYTTVFSPLDILVISILVTCLAGLLAAWSKKHVQRFIDRVFFRTEFETNEKLRHLSRKAAHMLDHPSLVYALTEELPHILGLHAASVVIFKSTGSIQSVGGASPDHDWLAKLQSSPEFHRRCTEDRLILLNSIPGVPPSRKAEVLMPIASSEQHRVCVLIGSKESGRSFTSEEADLFHSIADSAALGWSNATLAQEMCEQERIKNELDIAKDIQASMLPARAPSIPEFDIAARMVPAREMGGDFYDFLPISKYQLAVVVGDVSDKGISAAMVMASAISSIRFAAELAESPREILHHANNRLTRDTRKNMFIAVFFGIYDLQTRSLTFTNAGLPKPLLHRGDEAFLIEWSTNGDHLPLGVQPDVTFHQQTIQLEPGDILTFYSDGVLENANPRHEEFGVKRLRNVIRSSADSRAEEIVENIFREANQFRGEALPVDDMSVVVMKLQNGTPLEAQ